MKKLFFYLALISCCSNASAQDLQNSLLWRISGKGMQQPSYLFGTIHLQDRRVFNLSDSVYAAIGNTDVFSLEVNADSLNADLSAYYNKIFESLDEPEDKKLKDVLDKKELDDLDTDKDEDGIKTGDLTIRQAYLLREKMVKREKRADDMPTFLDAYLYLIAKDKQRRIAGLERLQDQLDLVDDMPSGGSVNLHDIYRRLSKEKSATEGLVQLYLAADLKGIQEWFRMLPAETEEKLLKKRNRVMLRSMDSIMKRHSLFAAVGTGHLPGNAGLIALLRAEGYTVTPVFSPTTTPASAYKFSGAGRAWTDVVETQDGYSVRMPGAPSQVDAADGLVKMKIFLDLATSEGYYICHIALPGSPDATEKNKAMDNWTQGVIESVKGSSVKKKTITVNGVTGRQYLFSGSDRNNYRIDMLSNGPDLYMLMSTNKNLLNNAVDSFHNSFRLIGKTRMAWNRTELPGEYISLSVPGKLKKKTVYDADSTIERISWSGNDGAAGLNIYVSVSKAAAGYSFNNDSALVESIRSGLDEDEELHTKNRRLDNCNAIAYNYTSKKQLVKGIIIRRGNRSYNILGSAVDNEAGTAALDSFLASVKLLPFPAATYSMQVSPDGRFKAMAPAAFVITLDDADSTDVRNKGTHTVHYISRDKETLVDCDIYAQRLSPYYWTASDTASLHYWMENATVENDSLTDIKFYRKGTLSIGEVLSIGKKTMARERIKAILDGRTLYVLRCRTPEFAWGDKNIQSFYESFAILKPDNERIKTTPAALFADLHSTDSTRFKTAADRLGDVHFSKSDMPFLMQEIARPFALEQKTDGLDIRYRLINYMKDHLDEVPVSRMEQLYRDIPAGNDASRMQLLGVMAGMDDSVQAYRSVKKLMLELPPHDGFPSLLAMRLRMHRQLAKTLYPDWLRLAADSTNGDMVCGLANNLIDSGLLSVASLRSMLPVLTDAAKERRKQIQTYQFSYELIHLLARFDTKEAWDEIYKDQYLANLSYRYVAVRTIIENGKQPDPVILDTIAADRSYRLYLYNLLKEKNRQQDFPRRFMTQQYFAESTLDEYTEDEGFSVFKLVDERTVSYKGKKKRFFLYELKYEDTSTEKYLGIVGPYDLKTGNLEIGEDNATGWEELKDSSYINAVFMKLLLQAELPPEMKELKEED